MSFRFVKFYALFLAGLLPGIPLLAQTNSVQAEQPIIFSSPDGVTVSNALIPVVQAPGTSVLADVPDGVPDSITYPQTPVRRLWGMPPMPVRQKNTSLLDEDGTGLSTPSQVMGVPTLADIFGLPKPYATFDQKKNKDKDIEGTDKDTENSDNASSEDGSQTNSDSSEDASWQKILAGSMDESAFTPDKPKSSRVSTGFFDSTPTDVADKNSENKSQAQEDSVFSSSPFGQTTMEQAAFNPPEQASQTITPTIAPAAAPAISPNAPTFDSAFSQGLNSQSPFALPQSASLGTLPQLPSLPAAAFQNYAAPQPATPSWAPKPPPWLSQVPQFGTMGQGKF
jgi:hypothetical protein